MKIVVTGALGHIGSRLIRELPAQFPAAEIVMLDNLLTQRYCALFNLPTAGRYRFIEGDILKIALDDIFKGAAAVVHLAAITDATSSFGRESLVEEVNLHGSEVVARACLRTDSPLLAISSTSVYGSQASEVDERCPESELRPQSPYAESKLKMERQLADLGRTEHLKFVVCRLGTVFGTSPGMRFHTAVNKFIWQACLGQPVTVWRTALHQVRPYLDLGDACRALSFLVARQHWDCAVRNILTLNATVNDILLSIRRYFPAVEVRFVDTAIMNQLSYAVSCARFRSEGFVFTGSLDRAIDDTVALLRHSHRHEPPA